MFSSHFSAPAPDVSGFEESHRALPRVSSRVDPGTEPAWQESLQLRSLVMGLYGVWHKKQTVDESRMRPRVWTLEWWWLTWAKHLRHKLRPGEVMMAHCHVLLPNIGILMSSSRSFVETRLCGDPPDMCFARLRCLHPRPHLRTFVFICHHGNCIRVCMWLHLFSDASLLGSISLLAPFALTQGLSSKLPGW